MYAAVPRIVPGSVAEAADDPIRIDELLSVAEGFSLIHRNPDGHSYSIHRLVPQVLADSMQEDKKKLWTDRAIKLVSASLESIDRQTSITDILMSHALDCLEWVLRANAKTTSRLRLDGVVPLRQRFGALES
jgi:hypothetical protein